MPTQETVRAAQAILAYRRGDGPANPHAQELCRRLVEIMSGNGMAEPMTGSSAFLAYVIEQTAGHHPEVAAIVGELAQRSGAPEPAKYAGPARATPVINITGTGHMIHNGDHGSMVSYGSGPGRGQAAPGGAGDAPPPVTILFAAASPTNLAQLRVEDEMREVRQVLELSAERDRFRLELRPGLQARDFAQALLRLKPRVVHFSGHGTKGAGEICFLDGAGTSKPASASGLRGLFSGLGRAVECVLLNACYAAGNAQAIVEAVPFVIGWERAVLNEVATVFAIGFYQALGDGMDVPAAHAWACAQMGASGIDDPPPVLVRGSN